MRKLKKPHNYVYLLHWGGFFYFGARSSWMPPEQDNYYGSGSAIREKWFDGEKPEKLIVIDFATRREALLEEARCIEIFYGHKLCLNFKRSNCYQIEPNERPDSKGFDKIQQVIRETERRYLDSFPDERGTLSINSLWRELEGLVSDIGAVGGSLMVQSTAQHRMEQERKVRMATASNPV